MRSYLEKFATFKTIPAGFWPKPATYEVPTSMPSQQTTFRADSNSKPTMRPNTAPSKGSYNPFPIPIWFYSNHPMRQLCSLWLLMGLLWSGLASAQLIDPTFRPGIGADGTTGTVNTMVLQSDGNILIGGAFFTYNGILQHKIARVNPDGTLDITFSTTGMGLNDDVKSIALQPDGKILIGGAFTDYNGTSRKHIARLNADGTLDMTFNTSGTGLNNNVESLALQSDGKVLVGGDFTNYNGTSRNYITRLNADGTLDMTFNPGAGANGSVYSVALRSDGKVMIGGFFATYDGTSRNHIARLNTDGTLDTGFNPGAGTNLTVWCLAIQPLDGKVLIGGSFTTFDGTSRNSIARLNTDGTLDTGFDPGTGADADVNSLAVQSDGKVLIGGQFTTYNSLLRNSIARLNANGTLDASFDPGTGVNNTVNSLAVQTDGKILIGGQFTTYNNTERNRIARLNTAGTLETAFNPGTGVNQTLFSVVPQPDGKVLIGGLFTTLNGLSRNYIARLNADGTLDASFNTPGTGLNSFVNTIVVQPDGKVLIGGGFSNVNGINRNYIARLNADGTLDASFNPSGTGFGNVVESLVRQPDGKVLVGGFFMDYNGTSRPFIARLNTDGTLDASFNTTGTGLDNSVGSIALQPDGKVLVGGQFASYNGTSRNRIARLNADGTLDAGFNTGTGANGNINSIAIQSDGKVLIGGMFTSYNGTGRNRIARLNADGTLDMTFNPGTGANKDVNSVLVQADGKVLIGGIFTTFNSMGRYGIIRLNADGTLDPGFNTGLGTINIRADADNVASLALQPDGKVLIAGAFTSYNSTIINRVARLLNSVPTIAGLAVNTRVACGSSPVSFTATIGDFAANYAFTLTNGTNTVTGTKSTTAFAQSLLVSGSGTQTFSLIVSNGGIGTFVTTNLTVNAQPTLVLTFPTDATVGSGPVPLITLPSPLPPGFDRSFQASGAASYERTAIVDRINGYEIRQTDSSTGGQFAINRNGLFTITGTSANGCSRTVQGMIAGLP